MRATGDTALLEPFNRIPLLMGLLFLLWTQVGLAAEPSSDSPTPMYPMEESVFPSLESAVRFNGPVTFCEEPVPIHLPEVRERLEKELLLMLWDRAQILLWLKRTGRYFPYIETALNAAHMPNDIKYIAVIESALKPHAGSHRGARGVWQFIAATGRNYGLTINRYIDERRNFRLATKAAIKYLRDLHEMFQSWTLACAAYNMGEKGLKKRIKRQDVRDYYHLDLPNETERYIFRAIAAKLIMATPSKYGFKLYPRDYYYPRKYDRILLKQRHAAPIALVAKAAGTYYKTIRDMNPQLLSDIIPRGNNVIFLPEGASKEFAKHYQSLLKKYRKQGRSKTYTVKHGDTLIRIARNHKIPFWKLLKLNNLKQKSVIHPGQTLVIAK